MFTDQDRPVASGNVVVSQANSRIAADRAEFNIKTKLGTFYNAWGMGRSASPRSRTSAPGPAAPPPPDSRALPPRRTDREPAA